MAFIACTGVATLALLAFLPGPLLARLAAMTWCIAVAVHAGSRLRRPRSMCLDGAEISIDGVEGRVVDGSFVAPWLTVVNWRPHGARFGRTQLVMPDMLDAHGFRKLRVILKWVPSR